MINVLVSTDWVADHATEEGVRVVEVDVDTGAYDQGHVPGSASWNWTTDLCDTIVRDIVPANKLEALLGKSGIDNNTTIVLYGDNNNWFAAWAFWQLKIYGHADVRMMDGGRRKWLAEGRGLDTVQSAFPKKTYKAAAPDPSLRAFLPEVQQVVASGKAALVDVRSPQEFSGEILAPPGLPETCQRGGHIPGARSIPWGKNCNDDGTFRSVEQLKAVYAAQDILGDRPVITYCRIGERSSLTWFALKYLLGFENVKNYDGSWTEWGNLVGAPVEELRDVRPTIVKPEEQSRRREELAGWNVWIDTYRVGDVYHCTISNVDPGARLARGDGATKDDAESRAIERATRYLAQARKLDAEV